MNTLNKTKNAELITRAIVFYLILLSSTTQAATITVDGTDGALANDGVCSISEAIIAANTNSAIDTCVAGDSTTDTINLTTDIIFAIEYTDDGTLGKTATPYITSTIIIDGMGYALQRDNSLTCNSNTVSDPGEFRLLYIADTGDLDLKNTSIENGCADGAGATSYGGGIVSNGVLKINNSQFINNKASYGGAIENAGTITEINNSSFSGNSAANRGGGIYNNSIITEINNSSFVTNSARYGGGITNIAGVITIISQSTFSGNQAIIDGGGIYANNGGAISSIVNSTFSGNSATYGAGLYNYYNTISLLENSTFANNNASNTGGGIFNRGTVISMSNNLFNNNTAVTSMDCHIAEGALSGTNNLSNQNSNNCTSALISSGLTANTVAPLADKGCTTTLADGNCVMTHELLAGSEALDAAVFGTVVDQRGFNDDGNRDIGAFESLTPLDQCNQNGIDTTTALSFNVNSVNELNTAIFCANANSATIDSIILATDITFLSFYQDDDTFGKTATPDITSTIIIDGMGYALQRDNSLTCNNNLVSDPGEFRLLFITNTGDLDLKNTSIENGCADGTGAQSNGGGIVSYGVLKINNNQFLNNEASYGGAIENEGAIIEIKNSSFFGNNAVNIGGGIYSNNIITEINNSSFATNSARYGGGIANMAGVISVISQSTFSGNQAAIDGGGIYANNGGAISSIVNSTFSGNSATYGAGLYNYYNTISLLENSTFANNNANNTGGGIFNRGTVISMSNNLFNNNTAATSMDCHIVEGALSGTNNLSNQNSNNCISAGISSGLTANTVGSLADKGCTTPLADGTCVMTHELLVGSEAIDMGNINATDFDQRNYSLNGVRDIGAFEYGSPDYDMIFQNGFD